MSHECTDGAGDGLTLPAAFYADPGHFAEQRERVLARAWHFGGDARDLQTPKSVRPFTLLEQCLDEPLVWVRTAGNELHCLSNVCTHRGNVIAAEAGVRDVLTCRYHGRCFDLDGSVRAAPGFEGVAGFPGPGDRLPRVPHAQLQRLLFVALDPLRSFESLLDGVAARLPGLRFDDLQLDASASRDYFVPAHWALYVDNYLEGMHIPYVHPELNRALEVSNYRVELLPHAVLQVGIAAAGEPAFDLPAGHPDHGQRIGGYYLWLYPTTMLNLYPWGVSLNVIQPLGPDRTRVRYLIYVRDPALRGRGAGEDLHRVELQDEAVVGQVQRGVRSRLYDRGRYAPGIEDGVAHFHRLLRRDLAAAPEPRKKDSPAK